MRVLDASVSVRKESFYLSQQRPTTVIFDLGNVVLYFDHGIICREIALKYNLDARVVQRKIFHDGLEQAFDEGRVSPSEFTRQCSVALGVPLDEATFQNIWSDIFSENSEIVELIRALRKKKVNLTLLSNTNLWHISWVKDNFSILNLFDTLVFSYEVGCRKPNLDIFQHALRVSGEESDPSQAVFIDDIEDYVIAAKRLGMRAILLQCRETSERPSQSSNSLKDCPGPPKARSSVCVTNCGVLSG